jgi:hypothetical protein
MPDLDVARKVAAATASLGGGIVVAVAKRGFDAVVGGRTADEAVAGLIHAPMTGVAEDRFDRLLEDAFTPINRWGTPDDAGKAIATMAAGDLPSTAGAAIQGDGGMHIPYY